MSKKSGFTLIEVLVASTIVIVLMTIGLVSYQRAGIAARDSRRKADLEVIRQALLLYRADNGVYPPNDETINAAGVALYATYLAPYLSEPYPLDPKNPTSSYVYDVTGVTAFEIEATLENGGSYKLTNP